MKRKRGTVLMTGGLLLMAAALFLTCYNLWDERRATVSTREILQQLPAEMRIAEQAAGSSQAEIPMEEAVTPDYLLNPNMEMPAVEIDGERYIGVLRIPALGLELPVMGEWSYPRLKIAPCRYKGSAYLDDLIIAAHNYKAHFGGLKDLGIGDEVTFTDGDGNLFRYEVVDMEVLDGMAVDAMGAGDWDLTLFTCTIGGRSRVTVRCDRIEDYFG